MKALIVLIFLAVQVNIYGSCGYDGRTLTEMLFEKKAGTIFTCEILAMTIPKQTISVADSIGVIREYYSSSGGIEGTALAKIIHVYFGTVDSSIITLKTGTALIVGKRYIIYTNDNGHLFSCGGSCDERTHLLTDSPENLSELKILNQFEDIYNNKRSGKYTFLSSTKKILATGEFKKGIPIKTWKHYFVSGILKTEFNLQSKQTKSYFANGFILADNTEYGDSLVSLAYSNITNGLLNYRWVKFPNSKGFIMTMYEYYSNGYLKLCESSVYIEIRGGGTGTDGKIGRYIEGHENGAIKVVGAMNKTKRIGLWKWFNEDGSFKAEYDYKDGTSGQ